MNITIKINTENDAFSDDAGSEVARVLTTAALRFDGESELEPLQFPLMDANGNTCGSVKVTR